MNPEVFLFPSILTDRYYFMKTAKKDWDSKREDDSHLVYDRQAKKTYKYTVYNGDFTDKRTISMEQKTINNEIAFWHKIEADELVEAYENGLLKGKLKEIAAELEFESNPVIMLVKHKK
jgi:hypothetical protein